MRNKILRSANAKYNFIFTFFFYKISKGDLDVFWCEFIDLFGFFFFGCYCDSRWIHIKKHRNTSKVCLLYLFYRKKSKNRMIFSVRRPQYFIPHTKSQRSLVTRHRLSCKKIYITHTRNVSLGCLWYHKLFCVFGDFYASGTLDAEVTKSLQGNVVITFEIMIFWFVRYICEWIPVVYRK